MFDIAIALAILALLAVAVARLDRLATLQIEGAVKLADGDSFTLAGERIRLRGIDAPESSQECMREGKRYSCGQEARRMLEALVGKERVSCQGWERDRYDRLLAVCHAGGTELGQAMVERGWAVSYGAYRDVETRARTERRGLWAGTFDEPSGWRAERRAAADLPHDWLGRLVNILRQLLWGAARG